MLAIDAGVADVAGRPIRMARLEAAIKLGELAISVFVVSELVVYAGWWP